VRKAATSSFKFSNKKSSPYAKSEQSRHRKKKKIRPTGEFLIREIPNYESKTVTPKSNLTMDSRLIRSAHSLQTPTHPQPMPKQHATAFMQHGTHWGPGHHRTRTSAVIQRTGTALPYPGEEQDGKAATFERPPERAPKSGLRGGIDPPRSANQPQP
jgi:hypothetical protein